MNLTLTESDIARFHAKISPQKDGCHLWTSTTLANGYGVFGVNYKNYKAHRIAFVIAGGEIPDGMIVRHTCDVKKCVNPAHLLIGTHQDNIRDRDTRGRTSKGELHPYVRNPELHARGMKVGGSVLTDDNVREMRRIRSFTGDSYEKIGKRFGVVKATAMRAIKGKGWRHVE